MDSPTLISRKSPFPILGVLDGILLSIEHSVSKQWRSWSDATLCYKSDLDVSHKKDTDPYSAKKKCILKMTSAEVVCCK